MDIVKLFYGLRICQLIHMEETTILFDKELQMTVKGIVVDGDPFFGDLQ
jgi:hypothetical protein